jgi:hypothetical protein
LSYDKSPSILLSPPTSAPPVHVYTLFIVSLVYLPTLNLTIFYVLKGILLSMHNPCPYHCFINLTSFSTFTSCLMSWFYILSLLIYFLILHIVFISTSCDQVMYLLVHVRGYTEVYLC